MTNHSRRQKGFTLIEAAVAIAVVAILSGIIVPLVVKNLQDSQIARAKNDIQVIAASIASQIKDTGTRPQFAPTGFGTGVGSVSWSSTTGSVTGITLTGANNTFTNLFTPQAGTTATTSQQLFYGTTTATTASSEFAYKGPYLAGDVAVKTDPWGHPYFILGYSATNLANNGPIWVVCAGPNGSVTTGSTIATLEDDVTWPTDTAAADDIVVRVN